MAVLAQAPHSEPEPVRVNWTLGIWTAFVGAVVGMILGFVFYLTDWKVLLAAQLAAGRWDEAIIVNYILSGLTDLMILAGAIWAVAAWGFVQKSPWAWSAGVIAAVTTLVSSFFWTIPAMSKGVFPSYMVVFVANLLLYLVLLLWVRPVNRLVVLLSLFTGIAYVLTFMNGVAGTDHIILEGTAVYAATQRVNWIASVLWAITTVGLVHRWGWAWPLGIGAGLMSLVGGIPITYVSTVDLGRFSLFTPAPVLSLLLLLLILSPRATAWYRRYCNIGE